MSQFIKLSLVSLIPMSTSIVLTLYFNKKNIDYTTKKYQISLGIIFGFISILGTELGVAIDGATINIRDAAPLCGGLIFGSEVGMISGLIGGIERWFAVYWGAGYYTRIACTLSTIIIGFASGLLRKSMFGNKIPPTFSSLILAIVAEVFHMIMVFITNINDPITAFNIVRNCSMLMITINSITVVISVLACRIIIKERNSKLNYRANLSDIFNKGVGILILVAFIVTSIFNFSLQNSISNNNCMEILKISQNDLINEVKDSNNEALINISDSILKYLNIKPGNYNFSVDYLNEVCDKFNVTDINIADENGIIISSSIPEFIGFDFSSGSQSSEFLCLLDGTKIYVQDYQPLSYDASIQRKYAGLYIASGGFIQVGYDYENFNESLSQSCARLANNRHVNDTGYIIILDSNLNIVSDYFNNEGKNILITGLEIPNNFETDKVYTGTIYDEDCYFMVSSIEGYYVVSTITKNEVLFERDLSVYLNSFLEVIVFGILFVQIYFLIKSNISNKVSTVNKSLKKITTGDLNEIVDVKSSKEFEDLSDGINETVKSLKFYINEAEKRIENELQYAKEIQRNSIPSIFPPFPGIVEFDIYATMDAAKEVGGDFYDFYMEGKHKVAFVVADVSGKGIPAALFMMKAKALIKTYVSIGISPADVLINVNYNLCEGNEAGMFVTCFLAYLDIESGKLEVANAGHNPPCIKHKDGSYEFLNVKAGFVLGGMEGMVYKDTEMQMEIGDEIFIYTDGVTEATNIDTQLFGNDRLIESLNSCTGFTSREICEKVKNDVDSFVGEADQFDDITMLSLKFLKKYQKK